MPPPARTVDSGLAPLVTQTQAATWLHLDRSRLSQLKRDDATFPAPLPEQMLRAIVGNTRVANVWSRDALVRWAQTTRPIRYSADRPIPVFPTATSLLGPDQSWAPITGGSGTIDDTRYGWYAVTFEQSLIVHVYSTHVAHRLLFGDALGASRLVSTAALSAITAAVNDVIAVPEFFTVVLTVPEEDGAGTVVAVTASIHDIASSSDNGGIDSKWAIGRTLAPAEAVEVLVYELPWFTSVTSEAIPSWTPGSPVPVAVVDQDALFAHQAHWWCQQHPGHRLGAAISLLASAAVSTVRARHDRIQPPAGWASPTTLDLPPVDDVAPEAGEVAAAVRQVRDAPAEDGVSAFLLSYLATVASSQVVQIRLSALPTLFAAAARDADGVLGAQFVNGDDGETLLLPPSTVHAVPVVAEVPVAATSQNAHGTVTVRLHADNALTLAGTASI